MPLPQTRSELLESLSKAHRQLDEELRAIRPDQERIQGIEGGLSCCDLVAYQIGWGNLLLGWEQAESQGQAVFLPAKGYKWNQLGLLAESFYQRAADHSLDELRAEWQGVVQRLEEWVQDITDEELFEPRVRQWTGDKWPIAKWIQVNSIAPYRSARTKLRRWVKEQQAR